MGRVNNLGITVAAVLCWLSFRAGGQELRPFYTRQESMLKCRIDSLYAAKQIDSVIALSNSIAGSGSLLEEDYTVYLNLYYCYKFKGKSYDSLAFACLNRSIDLGLKLAYGYDPGWLLTFDTARNQLLDRKLHREKENSIDSSLLSRIAGIWEKDQEWRKTPVYVTDSLAKAGRYDQFIREAQQTDSLNTLEIKRIIHHYGWPGLSLVGLEGDGYVWNIVQHADHDVPFQRYVLELLRAHLLLHDTNPRNFAYLYDRIKVNQGQPQLYGTQFADTVSHNDVQNYQLYLYPLAEPAYVETYRKAMGLPGTEAYIREARRHIKEENQPAGR